MARRRPVGARTVRPLAVGAALLTTSALLAVVPDNVVPGAAVPASASTTHGTRHHEVPDPRIPGGTRLALHPVDDGLAERRVAAPRTAGVTSWRTQRFTMVGATWSGERSAHVEVRVRGRHGWQAWQHLDETEHGPTGVEGGLSLIHI